MPIDTPDKLVAALAKGKLINLWKLAQNGGVEGGVYSSWLQDGHPGAGANPPAAPGASCDSSTSGAPRITPATGQQRYLGKFSVQQPSVHGVGFLSDRKWHVSLSNGNTAGVQAINSGEFSRGPAKELWIDIVSNIGMSTNEPVVSVTYVNQDDEERTVAGIAFTSSTRGKLQMTRVPLVGDDLVKSVTSFEVTTLTGHPAGVFGLVALDPIAEVPYMAGGGDEDAVTCGMPLVDDDVCLMFSHQHGSTATAGTFFISVCLIEEEAVGPNLDDLYEALSKRTRSFPYCKTNAGSGAANQIASMRLKTGRPASQVATDAVSGGESTDDTEGWAWPITPPSGGRKLYLTKWHCWDSPGPANLMLIDRLWQARGHDFGAANTLAINGAEPARLNDYPWDVEIWFEMRLAGGGNALTVTVEYINQDGVQKSTSYALPTNGIATTAGKCWPIPLAPGDKGVRSIVSMASSANSGSSGGRSAIFLARRLADLSIANVISGDEDPIGIGLPEVDPDACIEYLAQYSSSTAPTFYTHYHLTEM